MGRGEGKDGHVGGAERSECDGVHDQAKEVRNEVSEVAVARMNARMNERMSR